NFSARIFSITGFSSSRCGSAGAISTGAASASGGALSASGACSSAGNASSFSGIFSSGTFSSVFFLAAFLGRVEESIALRSILSSILGPSISGASILVISGCGGSGAGFEAGGASVSGISAETVASFSGCFFFTSFLNKISSSSFFFRPSITLPLGISIWSLLALAALSDENSCCSEKYISSVSLLVGFSSSLAKPFPIRKSMSVSCPILNSLAAANKRGNFISAILFCPAILIKNSRDLFVLSVLINRRPRGVLSFLKFFFQHLSQV